MPRPDGTLYGFERDKLKAEAKARAVAAAPAVKVKKEKPAKVPDNVVRYPNGRAAHPLHPSVYKGQPGRPATVKPTPELISLVCEKIKGGLSIESSLILAGLRRDVIEKWRRLNPAVNDQFVKAESEWESGIVANVQRMAASDLKANTFLLERRMASRWAPVSKTELTGKDGGAIQQSTLAKTLLATVSNGGEKSDKAAAAKPVQQATA